MKKRRWNQVIAFLCILAIGVTFFADPVMAEETRVDVEQETEVLRTAKNGGYLKTGDVQSCESITVSADELAEENVTSGEKSDVEEEDATGAAKTWKKYRSSYTYSKLSTNEKKLYRKLDEVCMKALTSKKNYNYYMLGNISYISPMSIGKVSKTRARTVYEIFYLSNPQYYFLANQILNVRGKNKIAVCVRNKYRNGSSRQTATKKIKRKLSTWNALIAKEKTILSKEKRAHDIIVNACAYDNNTFNMSENQQIDSIILTGKSVCAGYAQLFQMLCNKAGIKTTCVTSKVHQWNKIKLYGYWYNVDCTWDDMDGRNGRQCTYNYFNRSDKALVSAKLEQKNSHKVESFWKGITPAAKLDSGGSSDNLPYMGQKKKACKIKAKAFQKEYAKNRSFQMKVSVPKNSGKLTYSSSDKRIIKISKKGKAVIKGCGTVFITVKAASNTKYKAAKKKIKVSVYPVKQKITALQKKTKNQIKIKYKQDKNASGYQIMLSRKANFKGGRKILVNQSKITEKILKVKKSNQTYYIKVRSYTKTKNDKVWGKWSEIQKLK